MCVLSQEKDACNKACQIFLSKMFGLRTSKEVFFKKYQNIFSDNDNNKNLYLQLMVELKHNIQESNIEKFKYFSDLLSYIHGTTKLLEQLNIYEDEYYPFKTTNLLILACMHNEIDILNCIFDDSNVAFKYLFLSHANTILPDSKDETDHNAFYYAIRFGNVKILETLIDKWPNNYFCSHIEKLDELLSKTYEELKLKNISLSNEMTFFIEEKLVDLRFFASTNIKKDEHVELSIHNIKERISFVIENITLLGNTPNDQSQEFLFIAKSIAQNVHVLKRQLKSTYNILPWEEVEFCLVAYISTYVKKQELNLFYLTSLTKPKVMKYLTNFAKSLTVVKDNLKASEIDKLSILPDIDRNSNIEQIINKCPEFKELYDDYQQIRDVTSVEKISKYIDLASSLDSTKREGQVAILRCLQVIGECMKNTLESPKMSHFTSDLLLLSLPKNTRKIITDLRNSLTHMSAFSQINNIQTNINNNFFKDVQNDVKKIIDVIAKCQYINKRKVVKKLLTQMIDGTNLLDEMKQIAVFLKNFQIDKWFSKNYRSEDYENIEKLIKDLHMLVSNPTDAEKKIFKQIDDILASEKSKLGDLKEGYYMGTAALQKCRFVKSTNMNKNEVRIRKHMIESILQNMNTTIELNNIEKIVELAIEIEYINKLKMKSDNLDDISAIIRQIVFSIEYEASNIKSVSELRYKLNKKHKIIKNNNKIGLIKIKNNYNKRLDAKINELKNILYNDTSNNNSLDVRQFAADKKLMASVEMLMLDILSSGFKNCLENNVRFLDYNVPILIGKSLRNHLAHYNSLVDILPVDPLKALILNAKNLTSEKIKMSSEKIGKLPQEDISKLKNVFKQFLISIKNQEAMFIALENSHSEDLKKCIAKGADVHARGINSWTALHFAAKSGCLESVQFLLNHNLNANVRDTNEQTPLHVAAAYGSHEVIEFLIKNTNLKVEDRDNIGKTPLHIASENGNKNVVEMLLKFKAKITTHDISGKTPLHYSIEYNYEDIAKLLLSLEPSVDCNQVLGGFTPLHVAAEYGYLNLVNYLLKCKANVNAKTDSQATALHFASLNGHLEVVKVLILNGSNVNARVVEGCTPLHYALENGHEKIAELLLKSKANPNISDRVNYYTPLHYAAQDGHEGILKTLLQYRADATAETKQGLNPMFFAIKSGHLMIVDALLAHGVRVNYNKSFNYINLAIDCGHKPIIFLLLKHKINVNIRDCNNEPPIFVAALKGDKDIFDALIKRGATTNVIDLKGSTLLHAAAAGGNKDIIDALIQRKADVNAKTTFGVTPIHVAVKNSHIDAVKILIERKADIHLGDLKPLHVAVCNGDKEIVELLLTHGADVDAATLDGCTALHLAMINEHQNVFEVLLMHKARIDIKTKCDDKLTLLSVACRINKKDMVEMLINRGADVNADGGFPLFYAVSRSNLYVINLLLNNKANIHKKYTEHNLSLLHLAVSMSDNDTIKFLLNKGMNVNCETDSHYTPLHWAANKGHNVAVDMLLLKGAEINCKNDEGSTPLHIAAYNGCSDVVETLLNHKNLNINIKDKKNRTALEQAVANNQLEIVKLLLPHSRINLHNEACYDFTILHIAAQHGNLEIVRYLVDNGADINAKNYCGSKPIHIAARDGHINIVEFFCDCGQSVDEVGMNNRTLLHYTATVGQLEVAKYLIAHGADINAKDQNGLTALHIACTCKHQNIINLLLESGAQYNTIDMRHLQILSPSTFQSLKLTDNLFKAVKNNDFSALRSCIEAGAPVNVRNKNDMTVLHYATWKGYENIIDLLLENNSDPNMTDEKGFTSLHYAAKFKHLKILKVLLANGAVYNAVSKSGKFPENLSSDKNILKVLSLIKKLFLKVENNDSTLINDLKRINDNDDVIKAIIGARNAECKTLITFAICTNFSKIEELKNAFRDDMSDQENLAELFSLQEEYEKALKIYQKILLQRKKIQGDNNIRTLDVQSKVAGMLYKQQKYEEALNILEEIYQKQKELLGDDKKDTLNTKSTIALILHRQGKNDEALNIYRHVYQKQRKILPNDDNDITNTQLHMALVLDALGEYDEALEFNYRVYENRKTKLGIRNPATLSAQNNIAMVLSHQGKYDNAIEFYQNVFETRREVLGPNHSDTIRPLSNIAGVYSMMNKYKEALAQYQAVLKMQKEILGLDHLDTLNTQVNIGQLLVRQGNHISALRVFNECLDKRRKIVGSNFFVIDMMIEMIKTKLKMGNQLDIIDIIKNHDTSIKNAISCGDFETVQCLLQEDVDIDLQDSDGRTLLHFAVDNGSTAIVNMLIKYDASINVVTKRGNTPLHIACSKGHTEIALILLQNINRKKLNSFINAKTSSGGNTSLHVAAKKGHFDIVKLLLKFGAIYNLKNSEDKTPLDFAEDQNVTSFLELVKESFEGVKIDDANIFKKLSVVKPDKLLPILYARDNHENSLIQVAILNKHQKLTLKLVTLLKDSEK